MPDQATDTNNDFLPEEVRDVHLVTVTRCLQVFTERYPTATAEMWVAIKGILDAFVASQMLLNDLDWRLIETADKYAPPVELYDPTLIDPDFRPDGIVWGHWQDDEGWVGGVWCIAHEQFESRVIHPTHWRLKRPPT